MRNRRWTLERRPKGSFVPTDFGWGEGELPTPEEGEILVRNVLVSCDPAQRTWAAGDSYIRRIERGDVMRAFAVAEVVESRSPLWRPGQLVQGLFGWQDYAVAGRDELFPILTIPGDVPVEQAAHLLGLTGLTAYFGLLEVARPRPGQTVVVSAAAGATGSVVGQIAKIVGCRVIGIAGGPDKCRYLTEEIGFDAAIDYKNEEPASRLRHLCRDGIDVYFDNVGGRLLETVLNHIGVHARVVLCGAIATYNATAAEPGPRNLSRLMIRRARMEGFNILDYFDHLSRASAEIAQWISEGKLRGRVDIVEGLENAPSALMRLFAGENLGKQLVRVVETA